MTNTDRKRVQTEISRRSILLGSSAAVVCPKATSASTDHGADRRTFVLVHGAWHGGWCWTPVAEELLNHGHRVHQPTLTGLGERQHLSSESVDLDTHVTDVMNLIKYEDLTDLVLVGHSYAGFVITAVANGMRERIAKLVFLDAFLPDPGDSFQSITGLDLELHSTSEGVAPLLGAAELGILDPVLQAFVEARLCPHPLASMRQSVDYDPVKLEALDRLYVRTSSLFEDEGEKALRLGYRRITEAGLGHDAMLVNPSRVAEIISQ
jgi:pimeloyl-ACP methyl ester carboxylesterase